MHVVLVIILHVMEETVGGIMDVELLKSLLQLVQELSANQVMFIPILVAVEEVALVV